VLSVPAAEVICASQRVQVVLIRTELKNDTRRKHIFKRWGEDVFLGVTLFSGRDSLAR